MNIAFIAPSYNAKGQDDLLRKSAERLGIPLQTYGNGAYPSHTEGKLVAALNVVKTLQGYTHVLQTDAFDTLFLGRESEIVSKWDRIGRPPMLFSAEKTCYPHAEIANQYPFGPTAWRYICAGGWLAEIEYLKERIPCVLQQERNECDQSMWSRAFVSGLLPGAKLDYWCEVFQTVAGSDAELRRVPWQKRLLNSATGTYPAIVHWNGRTEGQSDVWRMLEPQ